MFALEAPARQLYLIDLVGQQRLQSAIGLFEVMVNASRVLGPAAAGVLIATVGASGCFFVNCASYVAALIVLARFRPATPPHRVSAARGLRALLEGTVYVHGTPVIVACLAVGGACGLIFNLGTVLALLAPREFELDGADTAR